MKQMAKIGIVYHLKIPLSGLIRPILEHLVPSIKNKSFGRRHCYRPTL
ncbi:hypothetical protein HMPREF9098_0304 [Kingella denitrificans ATCC 33394]|uniref:Uncharacterized protein n=1 Tax=Kingella denitrificans ATCC 33394 TaxID=888741 RepID=F0EWS4_9NEIS|nr:hypothetical protein HMPREF9098_0304 [Kingella denitrificans ATCC 33394]